MSARVRTTWVGVVLPLAWALGFVLAGWLAASRELSRARAVTSVRARFETQVGETVAQLDRLLDAAARRLSAVSVDPDLKDPTGKEEARVLVTAMQGALAEVTLPGAGTLTLYDRHAPDVAVLGRAQLDKVELLDEVPAKERLSAVAVEHLARAGSETGWVLPEPEWLWFETRDSSFHPYIVRAVVLREFSVGAEADGAEPSLYEGAYLVTASTRFVANDLHELRYDVVDGAVLPESNSHSNVFRNRPTGRDVEVVATLLAGGGAWRFPSPSATPRATLGVVYPWHPGDLLPWIVPVGLLIGGLLWWRGRSRRTQVAAEVPDVTAEAAHEMRTPLTVMRGALEVALRRERSPKEYQETLDLCLEEVKGLQNLQDAVLLLGRGARAEPAREPVDLLALAEGEVSRLRGGHPERQIVLDAVPEPLVMMGDPSLLARLLGNLLDNAALHSTPGGAIRIALARAGQHAVVTVADDGPGVPPARGERIFERFYRGPEASRRGVPGSGLGLPIARWLAELHGGSLTLDPEPTDRARFRLSLPLM